MGKLIRQHGGNFPGGLPEHNQIVACLDDAIPHCFERNLLAHGHWWAIDSDGKTIDVRSDIVRGDEDQFHERSFSDILKAADGLEGLEIRPYRLQKRH
jgi:hypothetical protein